MILLLNKENWLALYVAIVYSNNISPEQSLELVTESCKAKKGCSMSYNDSKNRLQAEKNMKKISNYFDRFEVGDMVEVCGNEKPQNKFRLLSGKTRGIVIYKGRYLSVRSESGVVITVNYSDILEKKMKVSRLDLSISDTKNLGGRSEEKMKVEY